MPWVLSSIKHTDVDLAPYEEAIAGLDDMTEPMSLIGQNILREAALAFETKGASGDRPWAPLTPGYGRWKRKHGPGVPLLIGLKYDSAGSYSTSGQMERDLISPEAIHISPHSVWYLPISDIAGFHQDGTPRMVARPPVPISERQLMEWDIILDGWVGSVFERVGL